MIEFIHGQPGESVVTGVGDYRILGERTIEVDGDEYLYVLAEAPVGSACVGAGSLRFIHVRGRVLAWHAHADTSGFPVSLLEPLTGDDAMAALRRSLAKIHPSLQVCF